MLWRILFSAVAISYLICVLFLSGMQKEDLDVSMLTKLHRYNVNIEDLNNEELKKLCITEGISKTISSTSDNTEILRNAFNGTRIHVESSNNNEQIKKNSKKVPLQGIEDIKLPTHFGPIQEKKYKNTINFTDGKPNIDSVLQFWDSYASSKGSRNKDRSMEIKKPRRENENTVNLQTNLQQSEIVNKLLSHLNTLNNNGQLQAPIEANTKTDAGTRNVNTENIKMNNNDDEIRRFNYPFNFGVENEERIVHKMEIGNESLKNLSDQNITDILNVFKQFSNQKQYEKNSKLLASVNRNEPVMYLKAKESTLINHNDNEKVKIQPENNQLVPEDMVRKIAQTVKDMVLQELRKEFHTITTTTTATTTTMTTTTTTTTSTTPKAEIVSLSYDKEIYLNQENIMAKFKEMFEKINLQQRESTNPLSDDNKNIKMEVFNKHRIIKNTEVLINPADIIINKPLPYNLQPQIHKFKSDTPRYLVENKPILRPITFQTNSLEIPPIGIPITHQQYPINQNIIVTTKIPFKPVQYESDNGPTYSDSASVKLYPKEILQSPLSAKFVKRSDNCPLHHECNHKNEDIIRFRLSNKGSTKYDTDYYEKVSLGKIEPKSGYKEEKNSVILPKFHEKLERSDGSDVNNEDDCCNNKYAMIPQMVDCCNQKIVSRQQMSIDKMKRGSYDDTHFRNFLKTQQKVTDMLEKILASRTKPELLRSVETT